MTLCHSGRNPTWKIGPISAIQIGKNSEQILIGSDWFRADPLRSGGLRERPHQTHRPISSFTYMTTTSYYRLKPRTMYLVQSKIAGLVQPSSDIPALSSNISSFATPSVFLSYFTSLPMNLYCAHLLPRVLGDTLAGLVFKNPVRSGFSAQFWETGTATGCLIW